MPEDSVIAPEFRNKEGVEWGVGVFAIEKGMVRRFAQAIGDPNPLWQSEAPPTLILTVGGEQFGQLITPIFPKGLLHGSTELECYQPVRPGDKIAVTVKLASLRERQKTAFATFEITYTNQQGQVVARCQQTMVGYEMEKASA